MNRREFIKSIGVAVVVALLPMCKKDEDDNLANDGWACCKVCGTKARDAKIYGVRSGVEMGCSVCVGAICSLQSRIHQEM